ncbi:MAG: dTMP kinase [Candidatus Diapherotrites archaeon]|nr:dTMP kinase [Candidatus Diapherotrites archaeon]
MKGKLIVLEGTDASGKTTQLNLLAEHLQKEGARLVQMHFPKHGVSFGKVVDDYLEGKFGRKEDLPAEFISLLYMADFYESKKQIENALSEGKTVLMSRYFTSTLTYQVALAKENEKDSLREWINFVCKKLPKPDLVLVLSVPPNIAEKLMNGRNQKKDQHESDSNFQRAIFGEYERNTEKLGWKKISCVEKEKLLSIEAIHEMVWKGVKRVLDK